MKMKTTKQTPRFTIRAIFYRDDKPVRRVQTTKKMRVLHFAQVSSWQSVYVRITYNTKLGYLNEFDCYDFADLKRAIAICTEPGLLEYAGGNDGD